MIPQACADHCLANNKRAFTYYYMGAANNCLWYVQRRHTTLSDSAVGLMYIAYNVTNPIPVRPGP